MELNCDCNGNQHQEQRICFLSTALIGFTTLAIILAATKEGILLRRGHIPAMVHLVSADPLRAARIGEVAERQKALAVVAVGRPGVHHFARCSEGDEREEGSKFHCGSG